MKTIFCRFVAQISEHPENPGSYQIDIIQVMWIVGIILLAFVMLKMTRRKIAKSNKYQNLTAQERIQRRIEYNKTFDQMNELMAALAELARQINGQIDTRLKNLEILLQQADEKIQQLAALNGHESSNPDNNNSTHINVSETIRDIADQFHHPQAHLNNQNFDSEKIPKQQISAEQNQVELSPASREVLDLSQSGMSKIDIAEKLHRPVGEIELILSLARKREKKDTSR